MTWKPLLQGKERLQNNIMTKTEYLPAQLEFKNPKVTIRLSAGPRWKFHLIPYPKGSAVADGAKTLGISDPLALGTQVKLWEVSSMPRSLSAAHQCPQTCADFHTSLLGGHFQPLRMDNIFSVATAGDIDKCAEGHVKYELLLRTGMDAYVMVFSQRAVDLNWIQPLQKSSIPSESIRGLWYSKRLHVECLSAQVDMDKIDRKLNKWLLTIQQPIIDKVASIGEHISAMGNDGFEEHDLQNWDNGTSMGFSDLLEFESWQNRVGPGTKWEDCKVSVDPDGCDPDDPYLVAIPSTSGDGADGFFDVPEDGDASGEKSNTKTTNPFEGFSFVDESGPVSVDRTGHVNHHPASAPSAETNNPFAGISFADADGPVSVDGSGHVVHHHLPPRPTASTSEDAESQARTGVTVVTAADTASSTLSSHSTVTVNGVPLAIVSDGDRPDSSTATETTTAGSTTATGPTSSMITVDGKPLSIVPSDDAHASEKVSPDSITISDNDSGSLLVVSTITAN